MYIIFYVRTRGGGGGGDIPWWTPLVALAGSAVIVGVGIVVTKWCVKHKCNQTYGAGSD